VARRQRDAVPLGGRLRLDPERALRAGHPFVVEDPVFCGWLLLALEECALAWEKLADTTVCRKLRIRSGMIAEGIASRLFWEEQEIYVGWNRGRQSALRAVTAGGLVPAASRALIEEGTPKRVSTATCGRRRPRCGARAGSPLRRRTARSATSSTSAHGIRTRRRRSRTSGPTSCCSARPARRRARRAPTQASLSRAANPSTTSGGPAEEAARGPRSAARAEMRERERGLL
jgi:hypothetical protein